MKDMVLCPECGEVMKRIRIEYGMVSGEPVYGMTVWKCSGKHPRLGERNEKRVVKRK